MEPSASMYRRKRRGSLRVSFLLLRLSRAHGMGDAIVFRNSLWAHCIGSMKACVWPEPSCTARRWGLGPCCSRDGFSSQGTSWRSRPGDPVPRWKMRLT